MKKGFTLIELLAVVVILAIVALIATPITLGFIQDAKMSSFKASLNNVFKAAEIYEANNHFNDIDEEGIEISQLSFNSDYNYSGKIIRDSDTDELALVTVGNDDFCVSGTKSNLLITKGSCSKNDETEAFNVGLKDYTLYTNKISLFFKATDYESGIKSFLYCFSEAGEVCDTYIETTSSSVELENLEQGTQYKLYLKAKNGKDIINTNPVEFLLATNLFDMPDCSLNVEGWSTSKTLTCNYGVVEGVSYLYSLDGETWIDEENDTTGIWVTNGNVKTLVRVFTEEATVYARSTDGYNNLNVTIDIDQIDNVPPTAPTFVSKTSNVDKLIINYTASTAVSNIKNYTCYYGTDENDLTSTGSVSGTTCTLSNLKAGTTYYFKMCATSNVNLTTCSTIESGRLGLTLDRSTQYSSKGVQQLGLIAVAYLDPTDLTKICAINKDLVHYNEQRSGCMKWYVYKQDSSNYTMILNHNTKNYQSWDTSTTKGSAVAYSSSLVKSVIDSYGWKASSTIISASEIMSLIGKSSWNSGGSTSTDGIYFQWASNTPGYPVNKGGGYYGWLYEYLKNCEVNGCDHNDSNTTSYWTSTPHTNGTWEWIVAAQGRVNYVNANLSSISSTHTYSNTGIRPSIIVAKDKFF